MHSVDQDERYGENSSRTSGRARELPATAQRPTVRIETPSVSDSSHNQPSMTPRGLKPESTDAANGFRQRSGTADGDVLLDEGRQKFWKGMRVYFGSFGLSWVTSNIDLAHLKPVIRASVSLWLSLILLVISASERVLGNVSAAFRFELRVIDAFISRGGLSDTCRYVLPCFL